MAKDLKTTDPVSARLAQALRQARLSQSRSAAATARSNPVATGGSKSKAGSRAPCAVGKAQSATTSTASVTKKAASAEASTPAPADDFSARLAAALGGNGKASPKKATANATAAENAAPSPAEAAVVRGGPVGRGDYVVKQGDTMASIAVSSGHLWRTIWDDAANDELRVRRIDPNVLLPDDRVTIPALEPKCEPGQTELRHRFVRRGEPAAIAIIFKDKHGRPRSNEAFEIEIDGITTSGFTDPEGALRMPVPGDARRGQVTLTRTGEKVPLKFGRLDPVDAISGIQGRLNNIGFRCASDSGTWGKRSESALKAFQAKYGLRATGQCDDATRAKLREVHGS